MNTALHFIVKDSSVVAAERCRKIISKLGAPLKSDSGHFVTGVVSMGKFHVDLRVTWLDQPGGSQITVTASHDELTETELETVAKRFRNEYLGIKKKRSGPTISISNSLFALGVIAAIIVVIVVALGHPR